jgi:hypothetical protein
MYEDDFGGLFLQGETKYFYRVGNGLALGAQADEFYEEDTVIHIQAYEPEVLSACSRGGVPAA